MRIEVLTRPGQEGYWYTWQVDLGKTGLQSCWWNRGSTCVRGYGLVGCIWGCVQCVFMCLCGCNRVYVCVCDSVCLLTWDSLLVSPSGGSRLSSLHCFRCVGVCVLMDLSVRLSLLRSLSCRKPCLTIFPTTSPPSQGLFHCLCETRREEQRGTWQYHPALRDLHTPC